MLIFGHRMPPPEINHKNESLMDKTWSSFTHFGKRWFNVTATSAALIPRAEMRANIMYCTVRKRGTKYAFKLRT